MGSFFSAIFGKPKKAKKPSMPKVEVEDKDLEDDKKKKKAIRAAILSGGIEGQKMEEGIQGRRQTLLGN